MVSTSALVPSAKWTTAPSTSDTPGLTVILRYATCCMNVALLAGCVRVLGVRKPHCSIGPWKMRLIVRATCRCTGHGNHHLLNLPRIRADGTPNTIRGMIRTGDRAATYVCEATRQT